MVAGLITLALVGMLQSLGALADTVPVDPTWRSDTTDEDERGHAAGRSPSSPGAIGPAAIRSPHRVEPTLDVLDDTTAPAFSAQLLSPESRAPPALLRHSSI